jgi:NADH:ubiquinone oxidoreductase subunit 5 (subunit L)/multisubunit Na+/H+ antiporter MnhA subunit
MYIFIFFSNLINSLIIGLFGKYIGRQISLYLSILSLIISNIFVWLIFYEVVINKSIITCDLYTLLIIDNIQIKIGLLFDSLTVIMLLIIYFISLCVNIYSLGYMGHDPFIVRFFTFLGLFTFFMVVLVTADNFLQLFVGWEGVGVCSYLLINFWYNRIAANKGAIKAMVMNRIADVFFIIGILFLLWKFKTTDYIIVFSLIDYIKDNNFFFIFWEIKELNLILLLLFIGAIGKSAQVGLHTWLADAMEGPTPVSSLLHAATMVYYINYYLKIKSLYWIFCQYNNLFIFTICWNT